MKHSYTGIYASAVCFICAILFSIAVGKAIYNAVEIAAPQFTLRSWQFECLQSNFNFVQTRCDWSENKTPPSPEELTELRKHHYRLALVAERRSGAQGILNSLIIMLVSGVFFIIHWRLAKRNQPRH